MGLSFQTHAKNSNIEYKLILGLRTEVESLEEYLWPHTLPKKTNRLEVWTNLLTSTRQEFVNSKPVMEFRSRLQKKNITVDFFY